ncbi:carbon-nitrogen family hydrolase [Verrucomicrobia bacterium]|nr:carbon-nitrogen family hydrolase [Verrucomicrobiota bacterium]
MNLTGVQLDIKWCDKRANFQRVSELVGAVDSSKGDLIVLPEMFSTGFETNAALIGESASSASEECLIDLARSSGAYLSGGIVRMIDGGKKGSNQCVTFAPEGNEVGRYRKIKPFTLGGEGEHYEAGNEIALFEWNGFKVASFVCYDLRFPELMRKAVSMGAEILTFIASWPSKRQMHWDRLLQARAIENQAYVIGVNRCGTDPQFSYTGGSAIFDYAGNLLSDAGDGEGVVSTPVDRDALLEYREKLPFLNDMADPLV